MPYSHLVLDWNGTLLRFPTDELQNKTIAYAVLGGAWNGLKRLELSRLGQIADLMGARRELKKRIREYEAGDRDLASVYEPFNERVLDGQPIDLVKEAIRHYARENRDAVNTSLLGEVMSSSQSGRRGILSVSVDYSIRQFLDNSGFGDLIEDHDIVSHRLLEEDGVCRGFSTDLYDQKPKAFENSFLRDREFPSAQTFYIGDSEDDEGIASILPRGNFILSEFASEAFKNKMARKHGAEVPEDVFGFLSKQYVNGR